MGILIITICAVIMCIIMIMGYVFEKKERIAVNHSLGEETNRLNKANAISDAILANIHAYILLIDKDFKVLQTNYYVRTGTIEDLGDKKVGDLLQCENAKEAIGGCGTHGLCSACPIRHAIQHALDTKTSFTDLEAKMKVVTSEDRKVEISAEISGAYLNLDNKDYMVITVHDTTAQKETERKLKEAKDKAENSDRSKSTFLANMSHEIRTPLNAITGFSEVLMSTEDPEEKKQYVEIIRSNSSMLLQLVNDILDISKIEAGTLEFKYTDVDVTVLIKDLEQFFKMRNAENDKAVEIKTELPAEPYTIQTDRNRVSQVLTNFITNAIKYSQKESITIGYEVREQDLYLFVKDKGIGIPEDKLSKLFDRFYRADRSKEGAGLGLAICKTIVDKLKGNIGVNSKVGEGSTFWFTIPKKRK